MVTKRKQHSSRRPVKQGPGARAPRPNKIGAATPYHFRGKNLTPYGGLLPRRHPARKTRLPSAAGRNPHDQTDHPSHEPLPVRAGPRARPLCRLCAAQPTPLHRSRPHPDRHLASDASAAAVHAVALSGLAAPQRGEADPFPFSASCGNEGRGPREVGDGDAGHRHHRAYPLRPSDGRAQELQPQRTRASAATSGPSWPRRANT